MATPKDTTKYCQNCGAIKPVDDFFRQSTNPSGHAQWCKVCATASAREWQSRNKERVRSLQRQRQKQRLAEGMCEHCRSARLPNHSLNCEKHYLAHIAKKALGRATLADIAALKAQLEKQGFKCPYTGEHLILGLNAHLDHKFPVSRFPHLRGDLSNLEWVTRRANLAKGDMTKMEFLAFCRTVIDHS